MRSTDKTAQTVLYGALGLIGILVPFTLAAHLGMALTGQVGPWNPFALILVLATHKTHLSGLAWLITIATCLVFITPGAYAALRYFRKEAGKKRGDDKAVLTGGPRASQSVRYEAVARKALTFGLDPARYPGYRVGKAVADGADLFGDWESCALVIAGPRTGKTTAFGIPLILCAPGAVLVTSNKRDIADATIGVRLDQTKDAVWVFDPCNIRKTKAQCFWNPLGFITNGDHYDGSVVSRANELSSILGDAARANAGVSERYDAFWDGGGDRIRAQLLAAAAIGGKTLKDVYGWLSSEIDDEPVQILRQAGWEAMSHSLEAAEGLPHETRGGQWACARMGLEWIEDPEFEQWWQPGDHRAEFVPHIFVTSRQTLYSISRDSSAATPLVAALTAVTCRAAEHHAELSGGRLAVPMVVVLDEAANVCPWRELPKIYSHFGSKGIVLVTIIQSWAQGSSTWGQTGMEMLWSAANLALYAGGMKDTSALENLSKLIGTFWVDQESSSTSQGVTTHSRTREASERPIAPVHELAALPEWRAWLFATHSRPVLLHIEAWFMGESKNEVAASLQTYGVR